MRRQFIRLLFVRMEKGKEKKREGRFRDRETERRIETMNLGYESRKALTQLQLAVRLI